jgi:hypothetical protein
LAKLQREAAVKARSAAGVKLSGMKFSVAERRGRSTMRSCPCAIAMSEAEKAETAVRGAHAQLFMPQQLRENLQVYFAPYGIVYL